MGQTEEKPQDDQLEKLATKALEHSRMLLDSEVQAIYQRYGLKYDMPSTDEYRLCAVIHAFEQMAIKE